MRTLLLLLLLMQPGQALAHAALLETSPADGATLPTSPITVRLRFDEPVGLIALGLVGPQGPVALTHVQAVAETLSAQVSPGLPHGTYLLSWRVTSVDSHPVSGTAAFGVGEAPTAAAPTTGDHWLAASMALRAVFLATLLVAVGGAAFRLVAEPARSTRRWLAASAWLGVALAAAQLWLRGALLADAPSLWAPGLWQLAVATSLGTSLGLSALGLVLLALSRRARPWVGLVAAILAVGGLPLSGHAGTAEPRWLTAPALLLHAAAAAFWAGAFWPLLRDGPTLATIRCFARAAIPAVALLVATGSVLASVQLGSWAALLGTAYGRVLLIKLGLVFSLLALAAINRLVCTPALAAGRSGPLRASIRVEIGLSLAVLAVTGVLGLTAPQHATPPDRAVWTQTDGIGALIEVAPGRVGQNRLAVTIDSPRQPLEVWLELRQSGAGVAAIRRRMRPDSGTWTATGPEIAIPGRWTIRIEALMTEFDETSFTTEMDIP